MKQFVNASGRNPRNVWNLRRNDGHWLYCGSCGRFYESKSGLQKRDGKLVCVCGKTDGWVAHFATFPSSLVERCLRPIPRQVCGKCGMPWVRVIDRGKVVEHPQRLNRANDALQFKKDDGEYGDGGSLGRMRQNGSLGFRPTCGCHADPRPATVCDPFSGTGTSGVVALRMGFDYIGVELSPAYAKLSEARLEAATRQGNLAL